MASSGFPDWQEFTWIGQDCPGHDEGHGRTIWGIILSVFFHSIAYGWVWSWSSARQCQKSQRCLAFGWPRNHTLLAYFHIRDIVGRSISGACCGTLSKYVLSSVSRKEGLIYILRLPTSRTGANPGLGRVTLHLWDFPHSRRISDPYHIKSPHLDSLPYQLCLYIWLVLFSLFNGSINIGYLTELDAKSSIDYRQYLEVRRRLLNLPGISNLFRYLLFFSPACPTLSASHSFALVLREFRPRIGYSCGSASQRSLSSILYQSGIEVRASGSWEFSDELYHPECIRSRCVIFIMYIHLLTVHQFSDFWLASVHFVVLLHSN